MFEQSKVEIKSEMIQGFQRIIFSGQLMYGETEKVREEVFAILVDCQGYILDMRNINAIDSTGFGILVSIAKKLKHSQHRMVVIINNPAIMQLFTITKMPLIFPIVHTKEEAVELLSDDLNPRQQISIEDY